MPKPVSPKPTATQKTGTTAQPKRGKGSAVLIRVTQETRAALEAEADRTGRSLSQTAEIWLDAASKGQAEYMQRMGGSAEMAAAQETLASIKQAIDAAYPASEMARYALKEAWTTILPYIIPRGPPSPQAIARAIVEQEAWRACGQVLEALEAAGPGDPVYDRARLPLISETTLQSEPEDLEKRLADALTAENQFGTRHAKLALIELRAAGETAREEIDAALALVGVRERELTTWRDEHVKATELGRAVAHSHIGRNQ
jgi:hypothetical protein